MQHRHTNQAPSVLFDNNLRLSFIRPNLAGGLTMKSEIMYLNYWICPAHAAETRWANLLLDKSPLRYLESDCDRVVYRLHGAPNEIEMSMKK